jgi:hypothetical protein
MIFYDPNHDANYGAAYQRPLVLTWIDVKNYSHGYFTLNVVHCLDPSRGFRLPKEI